MLQPALYRIGYTAVNFLIGLLLANILAPAYFGKLSLLLVNASVIGLLTGLGADSIVFHLLVNNKWNVKQALSFVWIILGIQVILFGFIQFLHISLNGVTALSQVSSNYLFFEFLFFLGLIVTEKYLVLYYSFQRARIINQLLLGIAVLYLGAILAFQQYSITYTTVLKLLGVVNFIQLCFVIFIYHITISDIRFGFIKWPDIIVAFKKSFVIMVTNIVQLLAYRIDFWLISIYYSKYEVGLYAQANKMANLIWIIPNVIALLVMPKFNNIKNEGLLSFFRVALFSNLVIAFIAMFSAQIIYIYFLAAEYSIGINSFYIMLPGYFCWALVIYFGAYFSWLGKFHYNFYASGLCLLLILLFDYLLIPLYSINGAALSNTIVYAAVLFLYLFLFCKDSSRSIVDFFSIQKNDFHEVQKLLNEKR